MQLNFMKSKTIYYESFSDDFAVTKNINANLIDDKYKYDSRNLFYHCFSFILYFIVVKPLVWFILKVWFGYRVKNKKVLKKCKNKGYFIYGNHTNYLPDAFVPNVIRWRRNYIVVGAQTVSIKGLQTVVKSLGAIPLGDTYNAKKNFFKFVKKSIKNKKSVTIYPEAHIWPYYTSVRPFDPVNIKYQVLLNCPSYTISMCYRKRMFIKRPGVTAYIDGPFYPDSTLESKDRIDKLNNEIYGKLKERTDMYSKYAIHTYLKKEEQNETRE